MKTRRSKNIIEFVKYYALCFCIFTLIFEILLVFFNLNFFEALLAQLSLATFVKITFSIIKYFKNNAKVSTPTKDSNPIKNAILFIRDELVNIQKKIVNVIITVVLLAVLFFGSAAAANLYIYGRVFATVGTFFERMTYRGNNDSLESEDDPDEENTSIATGTSIEPNTSTESTDISPPPIGGPAKDHFITDPKRYYELSNEDINRLFFLDGEYAISDWSNVESIARELFSYLHDLRSKQSPNSFDGEAPLDIQKSIVDASDLEAHMKTSDDLDRVILAREQTWDSGYRKPAIATLLGNNMQRYANEYFSINGNYETIKYYYAYSIFWHFKALTFEETNEQKNILTYISMRYHDIAYAAHDNSLDRWRATQLYEAFKMLENMDW